MATVRYSFDDLKRPVRRDVFDRPKQWHDLPPHLSVAELRLAQVNLDVGAYKTPVTGIVVGENPGPNTHPDLPLFPWPDTSSAGRLMAMSELTPGEYLGGLYRRNLVDAHEWSKPAARSRAREMITALFDLGRDFRVVLCGSKVARCFGVEPDFWMPLRLETRQTAVVIPHPSGLNRIYNDRACRARTRMWMRWAALGEDPPR